MIDSTTKQPIQVRTEDPLRPYLVVPDSQLDQVSALLTSSGLRFWVDNLRIAFDGTTPDRVQTALDTAG
jgi:hypothetical protein